MKHRWPLVTWIGVSVAASHGCTSQPDRFYSLSVLPGQQAAVQLQPATHVLLDVTVPSVVDRSELVIGTADNGILILDHERWAAPLADQVNQTLARDMELEKRSLLVADKRFDRAGVKPVVIRVEIVEMSVQRAGTAVISAHWRVIDPLAGTDVVGSDVFNTPVVGSGYPAIARAYSAALSALAKRLAAQVAD